MKLLLLGASGNAGMNFANSLRSGIDGIEIHGMDLSSNFFDNGYCDHNTLLPRLPLDEKIKFLNSYCDEEGIDFVHAQPDPEAKFLTFHQHKITAKTWSNSVEEYLAFEDKLYCQSVWSNKLDLSFECHSLDDCIKSPALFDQILRKSGKVWVRSMKGAGSKGALPVKTIEHAVFWAEYWDEMRGVPKADFMVAEYLPGSEYAVQTLWQNGKLVSSQARERVEYFFGSIMPSGQSSTPSVAKTINDREVYDTAYNAIKSISDTPHGIYCVDLKRNTDGKIIPLEVNYGRFFTTSNFFAAVGVNAPAQYVQLALGGTVEPTVEVVTKEIYWTRGLDRRPYLAEEKDGRLKRLTSPT